MSLEVIPVPSEDIRALRDLYRSEMGSQIIHYSWHERGWTDAYLFRRNGSIVGYGLVGGIRANPKDAVIEFFVLAPRRGSAIALFERLVQVSQARRIEVQTNDNLLTLMLYDFGCQINAEAILFRDAFPTHLAVQNACFRRITDGERDSIKDQGLDSDAEWMIEVDGICVATGGILFHYNIPYGDIYMRVAESSRRRGYGSYLVQELKRTCYEMGRIPAARCNDATNMASRATLIRAGMLPYARILSGMIKTESSNIP